MFASASPTSIYMGYAGPGQSKKLNIPYFSFCTFQNKQQLSYVLWPLGSTRTPCAGVRVPRSPKRIANQGVYPSLRCFSWSRRALRSTLRISSRRWCFQADLCFLSANAVYDSLRRYRLPPTASMRQSSKDDKVYYH